MRALPIALAASLACGSAEARPNWLNGVPPGITVRQTSFLYTYTPAGATFNFPKAILPTDRVLILAAGAGNGNNTSLTLPTGCTQIFYLSGTGSAVTTGSNSVSGYQFVRAWTCVGVPSIAISNLTNTEGLLAEAIEVQGYHGVNISALSLGTATATTSTSFLSLGHSNGVRFGVMEYDSGAAGTFVFSPAVTTQIGDNTGFSNHDGVAFQIRSTFQGTLTLTTTAVKYPTEIQADIY